MSLELRYSTAFMLSGSYLGLLFWSAEVTNLTVVYTVHTTDVLVVHSEGVIDKAVLRLFNIRGELRYAFGFLYHDSKFKFWHIPSAL